MLRRRAPLGLPTYTEPVMLTPAQQRTRIILDDSCYAHARELLSSILALSGELNGVKRSL